MRVNFDAITAAEAAAPAECPLSLLFSAAEGTLDVEVPGPLFHLDYLSCFLTVVSTILVGRKLWAGLAVGAVNSILICFIGFKTSQYGFIPANIFCIVLYAVGIRSWRRDSARSIATR